MTIKGAVEEAKKQSKQILVDMINVADLEKRAREVDALGVDYICVHTGYDQQAIGENPFEDLLTIKRAVRVGLITIKPESAIGPIVQVPASPKEDTAASGAAITIQPMGSPV